MFESVDKLTTQHEGSIIQVIYCEDLLVKLTKKRKGCISTVDEDVNLFTVCPFETVGKRKARRV